jgi:hypothetical protein
MNKALETHALIPSILIYSPFVAQARTDPRYAALMEKGPMNALGFSQVDNSNTEYLGFSNQEKACRTRGLSSIYLQGHPTSISSFSF